MKFAQKYAGLIIVSMAVVLLCSPAPADAKGKGKGKDRTPPSIVALHIESDAADPATATEGSVVTISLTANEKVKPLVLVESRALFARALNAGGNSWDASYTVHPKDKPGRIDYLIMLEDEADNLLVCSSAWLPFIKRCPTTDGSSVTIVDDAPPPPPPADTEPPVIDAVEDIAAAADSPDGAAVAYEVPAATDAVDGSVAVSCEPAPGSLFAVGETTVACEAADAAGNEASSTFAVTVEPFVPPAPTLAYEHWPTENGTGVAGLTANVLNSSTHNSLAVFAPAEDLSVTKVCLAIDSYGGVETSTRLGIYESDGASVGALIGESDTPLMTDHFNDWFSAGEVTCFAYESAVALAGGAAYVLGVDRNNNETTDEDILWYNAGGASDAEAQAGTAAAFPGAIATTADKPYLRVYGF